jgi:hypothetical protein
MMIPGVNMKIRKIIYSVAKYEFKRLSRSYSFRILVFFAVAVLILGDYFLFIRNNAWNTIRISSAIPYITFLFLNMFQTVVVLLLAADFIKTDINCDYTDSVYPRSMTNLEYISGKFLGIFALFFLFDICIAAITLIINLVFVSGASVVVPAYILYLFFITLPTLVFAIGISIFLMTLVRSQSLAFVMLSGYTVTAVLYLRNNAYSIFDLTAHHIIELYSDFTGFGNVRLILMHRGMYLLVGLGFAFFAVILFKRLPQSKFANRLSLALACILTFGGIALDGFYINHFSAGISLRQEMTALNNRIGDKEHVTVTGCLIELIHDGGAIDVTATISVINNSPKPLDTYYFSLNPGLNIAGINDGSGAPVPYSRDLHIAAIDPSHALPPGAVETLVIRYSGAIDEDACYVDIDEDMRKLPYGNSFYNISKRYSFVTPGYVMLTPETLWFPIAGVPFGSIYPRAQKKDFVDFELTVTTKEHLTAVSQGEMRNDDTGKYVFTPENPLPHMSLVIGEYETLSTVVDSIEYRAYIRPGHDYFSHLFTELRGEKLEAYIREQKNTFESTFGGEYPFPWLSFIEVPIHYYAYIPSLSRENQTDQPEMVFIPEKGYGLFSTNFESEIQSSRERYGDRYTTQQLEGFALDRFVRNILQGFRYSEENHQGNAGNYQAYMIGDRAHFLSYGLYSQYTHFLHHVSSKEYPFFPQLIENYIIYKASGPHNQLNSHASLHLKDRSFADNINDPDQKAVVRLVLRAKTDEMFAILEAKSGEKEFMGTLNEFIVSNKYSSVGPDDLFETMQRDYDIDLKEELRMWYTGTGLPGYVVTDGVYYEIIHNDRTYTQARFTIHNLEPVDSYILVRGREFDSSEWVTYQTSIKGNQSKEIGMIFDSQPGIIYIYTLLSQNIPNTITIGLKNEKKFENNRIIDGERVVEEQFVYEKPGEIIVDNEDDGFQIIEEKPRWHFLRSFIQPEETTVEFPRGFSGFTFEDFETWSYYSNGRFFGLYAKTAHIISGGNGQNKVQWTAELPEDGKYDLYYYSFYYEVSSFPRSWELEKKYPKFKDAAAVDDYNFIVYHDNEAEKVTRIIANSYQQYNNPVEVYLGRYTFSKGQAKIELTDETNGLYVFADAVKWVKKD